MSGQEDLKISRIKKKRESSNMNKWGRERGNNGGAGSRRRAVGLTGMAGYRILFFSKSSQWQLLVKKRIRRNTKKKTASLFTPTCFFFISIPITSSHCSYLNVKLSFWRGLYAVLPSPWFFHSLHCLRLFSLKTNCLHSRDEERGGSGGNLWSVPLSPSLSINLDGSFSIHFCPDVVVD